MGGHSHRNQGKYFDEKVKEIQVPLEVLKRQERDSYQPNISDCAYAVRLLSSHCSLFVSARTQPAKPYD